MTDNHTYGRSKGSQSEVPAIRHSGGNIWVDGYHGYEVSDFSLKTNNYELQLKFSLIKPILRQIPFEWTIADIGCSGGAIGLQIALDANRSVDFIDHDPEYIDLVDQVLEILEIRDCNTITSSVGQLNQVYDCGLVFALIHWIYSYSEQSGSLENVIRSIKQTSANALFIEWVAPDDAAIIKGGHLKKNEAIQKGAYNKKEFLKALDNHYAYVYRIGAVSPTREIYFAAMKPMKGAGWRYFNIIHNMVVFIRFKANLLFFKRSIKIYYGRILRRFASE